jgi:hypothetical protein
MSGAVPPRSQGWFARDEAAAIFGIKAKSFDAGQRTLLPAAGPHVKIVGKRPYFRVCLFVRAAIDEAVRKAQAGVDELLAGGGDSPALEAYRLEKAKLARLDRLERERQLLDRDLTHAWLSQLASIIRSAGETMQRQLGQPGREAHAILEEALAEYERSVKRELAVAA